MSVSFYILDVFTQTPLQGNQLAVIPDGRGLSDRQMQQIAREFNFSETTFVVPPDDPTHAARVRIFTPLAEIPFAGHPTLGTTHVLAQMRGLKEGTLLLEEGVGVVPVSFLPDHGSTYFELKAAQSPIFYTERPSLDLLGDTLGLNVKVFKELEDSIQVVACGGLPFLFVPLPTLEDMQKIELDLEAYNEMGGTMPLYHHIYAFTRDTVDPDVQIHARMFAPAVGVYEDPGTGSAAVTLAAYLSQDLEDGRYRWEIEQGLEMGRPCRLRARAEKRDGQLTGLFVGGYTVEVARGELLMTRHES